MIKMDKKDIVKQLDALIYNKKVQSVYSHIMLESIFILIEQSKEGNRNIPILDIFTQFAIITVPWVNKYQLLLKDKSSIANKIINEADKDVVTINQYRDIGKKLMTSSVRKWVVPNITKYQELFRCTEDKNIYVSQEGWHEISSHVNEWRKKNFEETRKLLYKYNPNKKQIIDQLFIEKGYLKKLDEIELGGNNIGEVMLAEQMDLEYLTEYLGGEWI